MRRVSGRRTGSNERARLSPGSIGSPHLYPLRRREVELLAGLHSEGVVPGVDVADGQRTVAAGGMHVGQHGVAHRRIAVLAAPGLREAEEEALLGREAVDRLRGLALLREAVRVERRREAGDVGDVLAEVDFDKVKEAGYSTTTLMTITNTKKMTKVTPLTGNSVRAGDTVIEVQP